MVFNRDDINFYCRQYLAKFAIPVDYIVLKEFPQGYTGKTLKFELIKSWVVRQYKNEYNPIHWHSGHISGVGYLKVPKSLGDPVQKESKSENSNGHLELIHGTKMFLSDSCVKFKPEVGNFYFFPNYMMHTVYPFTGTDEERRSISFNANVDDEIYNVYAGK